MSSRVVALDHVQLAMPDGGEAAADGFYRDVLGFSVLAKPAPLARRGGRWYGRDGVALHVGVDKDFHPATKAHPALRVDDLDSLVVGLESAGVTARWDDELPGVPRCFVDDPFGNRIELIDAAPPVRPVASGSFDLSQVFVHLGLGPTAETLPDFNWSEEYLSRY